MDDGLKSIKKLMKFALVFELIYFISICLENLLFKQIAHFFGLLQASESFIDISTLVGAVIVTVLFVCWYYTFSFMIKNRKRGSVGFSILVGVAAYVFYYAIPAIAGEVQFRVVTRKFISGAMSEISYNSAVTLSKIQDMTRIWLFAATILMVSAYAMYWFQMKYGQDSENTQI